LAHEHVPGVGVWRAQRQTRTHAKLGRTTIQVGRQSLGARHRELGRTVPSS
jgi:hypothetical protein